MKSIGKKIGGGLVAVAVISGLGMVFMQKLHSREPLWIYTSLYEDTVDELKPLVQAAVPDREVKWYVNGSEEIVRTVRAEQKHGLPRADLLLTADPFGYVQLKANGQLLHYVSPNSVGIPEQFRDAGGYYSAVRLLSVVIGYNSLVFANPPLMKWSDLDNSQWKGRLAIGNPDQSGSVVTAVVTLVRIFGWDFMDGLKTNGIIPYGDNQSVVRRIELKRTPVGILLLEDILKSQWKGSPVRPIYPDDGSILVPGYVAILKTTKSAQAAKKIYDFFLTDAAQNVITRFGMYSPFPTVAPPLSARPLPDILSGKLVLEPKDIEWVAGSKEAILKKFMKDFFPERKAGASF